MLDKTAFGISEDLRQYIEALVEEVVLEGKPFENHKKYLCRFCASEGIDYKNLETCLSDLFDTLNDLKDCESKRNERLALILGKECYLSDNKLAQILSSINKQRWEREEKQRAAVEAIRIEKEEAERKAREERERRAREEAVQKAREETERLKQEVEELKAWIQIKLSV